MSDKVKKAGVALMLIAALLAGAAGFHALTHSDFYAELERLNMDNHQH